MNKCNEIVVIRRDPEQLQTVSCVKKYKQLNDADGTSTFVHLLVKKIIYCNSAGGSKACERRKTELAGRNNREPVVSLSKYYILGVHFKYHLILINGDDFQCMFGSFLSLLLKS